VAWHARGYFKGGVAAPPHTPLQPTQWTVAALAGTHNGSPLQNGGSKLQAAA